MAVVALLAACAPQATPWSTVSGGAAVPSTSTQPGTTPAQDWAARVRQENALPGDPSADRDRARLAAPGLDAYADRVSVLPGQDVGLYVRTPDVQHVKVTAYRVGWYGGVGFRTVWRGSVQAGPQPAPTTLTAPLTDLGGATGTRAVVAPWHLSGTVTTAGWPEGMYVLRLDGTRASRFVPLTVRSSSTAGRVVVLDSPITWEAYNAWGGRSLYGEGSGGFAQRSYAVSFDRPYDKGFGAGRFFTYVAPLLMQAERLGLPLAWATDYDVAVDPGLLRGATAVVVGGHQEYWTAPEWDAVVAATGSGTNLGVFGANTAYWRVRLGGSGTGLPGDPARRDGRPRVVFGAKSAALDPLAATDPSGATVRFRDAPHPRSEELLTGLRYSCYPVDGSWTVVDPTWWGYAGTGLRAGERIPGLIHPETDRLVAAPDLPRPMEVVAHSPLTCRGAASFHDAVYWRTPAGGGVFTAGTMGWEDGMVRAPWGAVVTRITDNVLTVLAVPRAGAARPPHDDLAAVPPPNAVPEPPA